MGGHVYKLSEAFPPEVATEVVLLIGPIVDVTYHHSVLLWVDEVLQMVLCCEQWLLL